MKKTDLKRLFCLAVSATIVFSISAMALADDLDEDDGLPVEVEEQQDENITVEEDLIDEVDPFVEEDVDESFVEEEQEDVPVVEEVEDIETEEVSAAFTGWKLNEDGYYNYYRNDVMVKEEFLTLKGKTYYLDGSGRMIVGLYWVGSLDEWYYFGLDGAMLTGWQKYNGAWHFFDPADGGKGIVSDWYKDPSTGNYYYFGSNGVMVQNTYRIIDGKYYAFNNSGVMLTNTFYQTSSNYIIYLGKWGYALRGWQTIDGKKYYFNEDINRTPYAYSGNCTLDGNSYFFDYNDSHLVTGWHFDGYYWEYYLEDGTKVRSEFKKINSKWYYFDNGGDMVTGVRGIDGVSYYFNDNGVMQTGWQKPYGKDGGWYYYLSSGAAAEGLLEIKGKTYYFDEGFMTYNKIVEIGDDYYFFDENGVMVKDYLLTGNSSELGYMSYYFGGNVNVYAYFGSDGKAYTGWKKIDGKYYYFQNSYFTEFPISCLGTALINNKLYFFDMNGVMQTGWICSADYGDTSDTPQWMYADSNGVVAEGWKKINGKWYYFDSNRINPYAGYYGYGYSSIMVTGIVNDPENGHSFYCNSNGAMQTGWIKFDGGYYYANSKGVLQTGWQEIGGKHYYFNTSFEMLTGFYLDTNTYNLYYFDSNGVCQNYDDPYYAFYKV